MAGNGRNGIKFNRIKWSGLKNGNAVFGAENRKLLIII